MARRRSGSVAECMNSTVSAARATATAPMARAEPFRVWASAGMSSAGAACDPLHQGRRLAVEQLQDLALERPLSERGAGQVDEVDRALDRTGGRWFGRLGRRCRELVHQEHSPKKYVRTVVAWNLVSGLPKSR